MARADIRVGLSSRGASLAVAARELRRMDGGKVKGIFRRHLEDAARPYPARVRASVMAIPVKPGGKHTGLRERIAGCVELSTGTDMKTAWASVWVNPRRMLPDYYTSLPLYMEGVNLGGRGRNYTRWRHPVYGRWLAGQRNQPSHPYFYGPVAPLGRAAAPALERALEDISRQLRGY